jgi:hypothetical protein
MAAGQHNPTRRALLGAAMGVPLSRSLPRHCEERSDEAIQGPALAPGGLLRSARNDGGGFGAALAAFRAAQAEVAAIEAATAGRSAAEEEAWLPAHDAACAAMEAALAALLALPAPNLPAFAVKLDLLFTHRVEPGAADEADIRSALGDARRFASFGSAQPSRD